jgi:hypothetical protein
MAPCPGCGVNLPPRDGATDPYGAASPACWAAYGELMALEFSGAANFASHRLSVDAYMTQHASRASRASIQSVWVHLAALHMSLELGYSPPQVGRAMAQLTHRSYTWLEPPPLTGQLTIGDMTATPASPELHFDQVQRWAKSVWQAWAVHHDAVRALVREAGKRPLS